MLFGRTDCSHHSDVERAVPDDLAARGRDGNPSWRNMWVERRCSGCREPHSLGTAFGDEVAEAEVPEGGREEKWRSEEETN